MLVEIFVHLLQPAYTNLMYMLSTMMIDNFNFFHSITIGAFGLFFAIITICYFFVWIPFENGQNLTIYKTKKMLSILPKEVLAKISNIHKLLEIDTMGNKKNRIDKVVTHSY